jgi:hypothetical protein
MEDDAPEFSTTPAADLVGSGIGGLAIALGLCPEAAQSGKRTKMIHKKGEVQVAGTPLVLKWNVDYKAGAVVNLRVVTLKPSAGGAPAEEIAAGSATDGETSAPTAGIKRKRKEPVSIEKQLQIVADALAAEGKTAESEQLIALLRSW